MIDTAGLIGFMIVLVACCAAIAYHYGVQRSLKRQRLSDGINDAYILAMIQAFRAVPDSEGKGTSPGTWNRARMIRLELDGRQTLILGLSPDELRKLNSGEAVITRGTTYDRGECIIVTAHTAPSDIRRALEQAGIIPGHPHTAQGIQE